MESIRQCTKCGEYKPLVAFATFRTLKGEPRRRGVCAECRAIYAKENFEKLQAWRKEYNVGNRTVKRQRDLKRRAEARAFVDSFKSRPCADCGGTFPPVAMDLDHVRGDKFKNVANLVGGAYRIELIKAELEKCDVVCACCHRIRTAKQKENKAPTLAQLQRRLTGSRGSLGKFTTEEQ